MADGIRTAPITVAIPSIPARGGVEGGSLLNRAIRSVHGQTLKPAGGIAVYVDWDRRGVVWARRRALDMARTEWVAFLDDDDEMLPKHLELLWQAAQESSAVLVHSWFYTVGGPDPDPAGSSRVGASVLALTGSAMQILDSPDTFEPPDVGLVDAARHHGGVAVVQARTWLYHTHPRQTAGRPDLW